MLAGFGADTFELFRKDGTQVILERRDKGDDIGRHPDGSPFEAITTWFRVRDAAGMAEILEARRAWHAFREEKYENNSRALTARIVRQKPILARISAAARAANEREQYLQLPYDAVMTAPDPYKFRFDREVEFLENAFGLDVQSPPFTYSYIVSVWKETKRYSVGLEPTK